MQTPERLSGASAGIRYIRQKTTGMPGCWKGKTLSICK